MRSATHLTLGLTLIVGCSVSEDDQDEVRGAGLDSAVSVVLETTLGDIVVDLYPKRAPVTTENFLRHVDSGYYDGTSFYRAVRLDNQPAEPYIEVVQGGIGLTVYAEGGSGPPFPPIEHEPSSETGLKHVDGAISMGRLAVGTAASEFFICINDQPSLDFGGDRNPDGQGFAAFGMVVEGMDVVRRIQAAPTGGEVPPEFAAVAGQIISEPIEITEARRL